MAKIKSNKIFKNPTFVKLSALESEDFNFNIYRYRANFTRNGITVGGFRVFGEYAAKKLESDPSMVLIIHLDSEPDLIIEETHLN